MSFHLLFRLNPMEASHRLIVEGHGATLTSCLTKTYFICAARTFGLCYIIICGFLCQQEYGKILISVTRGKERSHYISEEIRFIRRTNTLLYNGSKALCLSSVLSECTYAECYYRIIVQVNAVLD